MKALIAYGTRFGATAGTAQEIAKVLGEEGLEVKVADLRTEKIDDLSGYGLVVIGNGLSMGNWASETEDFVKKSRMAFEGKKLALFVSSLKPVEEKEGRTAAVARIRKVGVDDKILKYHLKPISVGIFGGVVNYNKIGFLMRKGMEIGYKSALKKHGFKEVEAGVYDLRDWNEIRGWAQELSKKSKE
ncbi:MAG TPA: flavodoxin domain-containing protein [Candidatus Binatia bacterium]|nr:flavodoxin domain-containing protein [Candidatus Binatia bacterium]